MAFATSRNSLRTASDVYRGSGSGRAAAGDCTRAAGAALHALRQLAQLGLGNLELELVELFVQHADPLPVVDPERVELGLHPSEFGAAFAEHGFELGHPRAQPVQVVVIALVESGREWSRRNDIGCFREGRTRLAVGRPVAHDSPLPN